MKLIKESEIKFQDRPTSIDAGVSKIGWAVDSSMSKILAGFGLSNGDECKFKTIDYEEVIFVISGKFGAEIDGVLTEATAGDVLHIPPGSTVRYVSENAKFFFAISNVVAVEE
ncbi:hypothetical protein CRX42_14525 [Pseudomonas jessenii]|uniref:Ethanolamine utilization protein EutQ n=1 Tax=Pseudomonas jessenii TaxID=77298 RepID=A0A2W0EQ68_PSEJE|nr:hypothetical protein [Pseudomonas jessenii]PYY69822.1 hypothetical protein CRX42_14525 [Pseudomonas jessenii]